jgi:hypothetical protein
MKISLMAINSIRNLILPALIFASVTMAYGQALIDSTTFKFGGYIKTDIINTWYQNGDVGSNSPLRDIHIPGQIPIGVADPNYNLDFHVKESRFNFDVETQIKGQTIHGFLELDFLFSNQGDEKVSNSFSPRLRHFYFEWKRMLIGQTWSTFMMVVIPDDLDLAGAMDGIVLNRQPQVRYKAGNWWFSVENPETTVIPYQSAGVIVTEKEVFPDIVIRRSFPVKWGNWSAAAMYRTLSGKDSTDAVTRQMGFGVTTGGKILVGKNGGDLRIVASYGQGLGRYLSAGFISDGVLDPNIDINAIESFNGYVAYKHFWIEEKLASTFNISGFKAFNDATLVGPDANTVAYSLSANLKYTPVKQLMLGVELMNAYREVENGKNGSFNRLQFSARYSFGYTNVAANEKK